MDSAAATSDSICGKQRLTPSLSAPAGLADGLARKESRYAAGTADEVGGGRRFAPGRIAALQWVPRPLALGALAVRLVRRSAAQ